LLAPLIVPFGIAVVTYIVALVLRMVSDVVSNEFAVAVVVLTVSLGFLASVFISLRRGALE